MIRMGRTVKASTKLKKAFKMLGIELRKTHSFYGFTYEHIYMIVSSDEETMTYAIISHVVDPVGNMNQEMLETAIDVIAESHHNFSGDWNNGVPYLASPCYSLIPSSEINSAKLSAHLKEFYNAYMFLEANIHLLGDKNIAELVGIDIED